jgi:glycosyltransferase involved in cell wall biosynthesis
VLTCTADNKRFLRELCPGADPKVRVSYHGLDLTRFRPGSRRDAAEPARILAVGSLLPCKGFDQLIEACRLVAARGLDFQLTIVGGGPLEADLKAAAAAAGLSGRIHFAGYQAQEAVIESYRSADLLVLPAVLEMHWGIPNVLVEALACGVPVITTPLPSLPELVEDGVHGLVVQNRNVADLTEKLERLLREPELRRTMGQAGRARVEQLFDIDKTIATVVEPLVAPAAAVTP